MMLYMLDTNAASEAMRGHPAFDTRLQALPPGGWCISPVTCSEICYGLARRPEAVKLHRLADEFLRIAPTPPWDAQASRRHGELRAALKARGEPIGDFDDMLAAHALSLSAILVADNTRHFTRVSGLVIENWLRSSPNH